MRTILLALLAIALPTAVAARVPAPPVEVAAIPVSLLVDLGSGQMLHARQPDQRFVPASVTKVMTAFVAFEQMAKGKLKAADLFTVTEATARQWNGRGTSLYLTAGNLVSADTLLHAITTVSANDACIVLSEGFAGSVPAWTLLMNAEARRLGMRDSHFATPNGWPDNGATYVTARDLVKLSGALIARHPALYRRYFGQKSLTWNGITQQNRDPILGLVAGADGIKTGHTDEAGYNFLGSAERNGRRLVMVIAGAHSEAQRARASRALMDWGFSAWRIHPLFPAGARLGEARVQGGDARRIGLVAPRAIHAALPRDSDGAIRLRITYRGPLAAPVAKGAEVAELEILTDGGPPGRVPLFAAESVGRASVLDRLLNGLAGLFS